jgi:hypothetical protein
MSLRDFVSGQMVDDVFDSVADDVIYAPQGNNPVTIQGIFHKDYLKVLAAEMIVESSTPMVVLRSADVPNLAHGDKLSFDAVDYKVVEIQAVPSGVVRCGLERWS